MCRELARAVGELWRTIGDALSPYRPELHYMRGPGPKCRVKHQGASCDDLRNLFAQIEANVRG